MKPLASERRRRFDAPVPSISFLIGENSLEQMAAAKIGPQSVGDPNLGVCNLPQQEVADAHLAARADEQIGIGLPRRVKELREFFFVEVCRPNA